MQDSAYPGNTVRFCRKTGKLTRGKQQTLLSYTDARLLSLLLDNQNEVVKKQQLLDYAWEDVVVTDASLAKSVARIRLALTGFFPDQDTILSIPRIGYKLILPVGAITGQDVPEPDKTPAIPHQMLAMVSIGLLSITLLGLSVKNFISVLPQSPLHYLHQDYLLRTSDSESGTVRLIYPQTYSPTPGLMQTLIDKDCACTWFIEPRGDLMYVGVFDPSGESRTYLIKPEELEAL